MNSHLRNDIQILCFKPLIIGIAFEAVAINVDMAIKTELLRKTKSTKQKSTATPAAKKKEAAKYLSMSYNEYKNFEGQQYSGMKVGR